VRKLALLALLACLGGCGAAADTSSGPVTLTSTRDFGRRPEKRVTRVSAGKEFTQVLPGAGTAFLNGIEVDPAKAKVYAGDQLWRDTHRSRTRVPAVVGAFPQPFRSGSGGKRFPVRIECATVGDAACNVARDRLVAAGIGTAAVAGVGGTAGQQVLRVEVGPWKAIRIDPAMAQLADGPRISGVFARPAPNGSSIAVLDPAGATVRTLGPGDGLIAATRIGDQQPTWAVTGVDAAGALAAARELSTDALRDRFAAGVVPGGPFSVP
jgi:hypothetical protein